MSDSIWKKEITFRRKSTDVESPESFWHKEISLGRRNARKAEIQELADAALRQVEGTLDDLWGTAPELPTEPLPDIDVQPAAAAAEEPTSIWKREISLKRQPKEEEAADEPGPVVPEAEAAAQASQQTPLWKREISLKRQPQEEEAAGDPGPVVPEAEAAAQASQQTPLWKREISLKRRPKDEEAAAPEFEPEHTAGETRRAARPKESGSRGRGGGHPVKRIVGLKIGASQLAAARVANNGAAELLQVARQPLEQGIVVGGEVRDPEALAAALKQFFARNKLPRKNVRLGIASNRIGVRIFDVDGIDDEKQLENAIRFRAQDALPIPLDEAVLDYHILAETTDHEGQISHRVLLVVAYRELVERYVSACRKAGISLAGIDLEAFALLRSLAAPTTEATQNDAALVAVAIGHDRSTFAVSGGNVCEFTRVIEWGGATLSIAVARALDVAPSEVENLKRLVVLDSRDIPEGVTPDQYVRAADAVRKQVQAFARELVSSLQFYQHQPGSLGIGEIVITGGTASLRGLAAELEGLIGVRVRVGDPLARLKVPKKLDPGPQPGSLAIAIGLGIED
jgi:type IV pilus assembly protein PilM